MGASASLSHGLPDIRPGTHIAALYSRPAERDALVSTYLRDGLAHDHSCTAFLSLGAGQALLEQLRADVDVDARQASGQFTLCCAPDRPTAPGDSGAEAAARLWNKAIARRPRDNFRCARLSVDANAWNSYHERHYELLRFESQLTALAGSQPIALMFIYDVCDLDGGLVVELVRTHPRLWTYGAALANPYYTAPPGDRSALGSVEDDDGA